jgi:flap endonuclease-1
VQKYGRLEDMPEEIFNNLPPNIEEIRRIFLKPEVLDNLEYKWGSLKEDKLFDFLCYENNFSTERVKILVKRMRGFYAQRSLETWLWE